MLNSVPVGVLGESVQLLLGWGAAAAVLGLIAYAVAHLAAAWRQRRRGTLAPRPGAAPPELTQ